MTPEQTALYNNAMLIAWQLAHGNHVNAAGPEAQRLIAAANAAATADGGKTLKSAASDAGNALGI
jgi:hypothetical protein